ncbi:MAG: 30S ribosomal protein S16, partial [Pseudomonadota bacterium]|nr:30S ribosomal protein S16 [Pseudomonadota bacterium]
TSRDGRFIERIGYFNPLASGEEKALSLDLGRIEYWIGQGAQPSARVKQLMRQAATAAEAVETGEEETAAAT